MSTETHEVRISIDFHDEQQEIIGHEFTTMTREQAMSLMISLGKMTPGKYVHENAAIAGLKIYHALSRTSKAIHDEEMGIRQPLIRRQAE